MESQACEDLPTGPRPTATIKGAEVNKNEGIDVPKLGSGYVSLCGNMRLLACLSGMETL